MKTPTYYNYMDGAYDSYQPYQPYQPFQQPSVPSLYPVLSPRYSAYVPVTPPKPLLTQAIHNQTLKLLAKASEMSTSILYGELPPPPPAYDPNMPPPPYIPFPAYQPQQAQPAAPRPAPTTYNFDFSDKSWRMFNNETHVHHHGEESDKKDDTGTRILVGLIGIVAAGAAAFFLGKTIAQGEEVEVENQSFEDLKTSWNHNKMCYEANYQATVESIMSKADALSQRNQTNRTHKIALLVFGFIGGGTAVAGAIVGSSALMATAAAVGALVSVAALFKLGYACFSTRDQNDAESIERNLEDLRKMQLAVV